MARRKRIAVITADIFTDYTNRILTGICGQSTALGYDTVILTMTFNLDTDTQLQSGEENIYSLLTEGSVDGAIMVVGNMSSDQLVVKITGKLRSLGIPVVSVERDLGFCESVYAEDTELFELMTDHFIEHHGCNDIACLTGFRGNAPAESRLEGYKRSLRRHGIEIKDENIIYGDFWKVTASELAKEYIEGKRKLPQAIVCANDSMGTALCIALMQGGIKVPEDVMISGYDGSKEAADNIPPLTTIIPGNSMLGARAVAKLHKLMSGEDVKITGFSSGSLVFTGSCGCRRGLMHLAQMREDYDLNVRLYEGYFNRSGMQEGLMEEKTLEGLLHRISEYYYCVNGLDLFMLCLDRNWDGGDEKKDDSYLSEGYPETMDLRMIFHRGETSVVDSSFDTADILPPDIMERIHGPASYILLPLHYMDRCFGYTIYHFSDMAKSVSMVFALWNRNINTALEFLRVRTKLTRINNRILMNSIRDTLTGVYNRKGFKRYSETIFKRAQNEQKKLLIIIADLDLLKHINDNYGHIEGDRAITITANALNTCCENNEVCARIGGDEFVIIGSGDYTDEMVEGYLEYIRGYFDRYNDSEVKPYKVGASIGSYCEVPGKNDDFHELFGIADRRMYEDKKKRRKIRED